ncbi:MAG: transcriptional repressor [Clostridia bacterium]|nr:transcriptional repressor [Clostridia bacterium]
MNGDASARLEAFQARLAAQGQRVTSQRLAIYAYLIENDTHPTAEEIYRALRERFPVMSPATVYKTLDLLVEMGLVTRLGFGGQAARYDGNPEVHANLLCVRCGLIRDLELPELEAVQQEVQRLSGYRVLGQRYEFYGLCPDCGSTRR